MDLELEKKEFLRFRDLVAARVGIYFDQAKENLLRSSLLQRMKACRLGDFSDYFELLSSGDGEKEFRQLLNLITIHETYFFRDQAQFMALKHYVIPEMVEKKSQPGSTLRIWSAGCSSGEEPYTIAMIVRETMAGRALPAVEILATDVSEVALEAARQGRYRPRSVRNIPEEYLRRFFTREGELYLLDQSIKDMVEFRYFNLAGRPYPLSQMSGWDIIFCRNVTIYFQPESTRRVIHNFYQSLVEGGYLFTGFAETLRYLSNEFTTVQLGGVFLYQKRAPDRGGKKLRPALTERPRPRQAGRQRRPARPRGPEKQALAPEAQACAQARKLLEAGRPEEASRVLRASLEEAKPTEEAILLQAEIALNRGELEEAAQLCQKVIQRDPLSIGGHFLLGIVHRIQEEWSQAVADFKRVLYLKPDHALAHFYLADLLALSGQVEEAKKEYANAVRLLVERPESFDNRFAGGFSPNLLIDTCRSRLQALNGEWQAGGTEAKRDGRDS